MSSDDPKVALELRKLEQEIEMLASERRRSDQEYESAAHDRAAQDHGWKGWRRWKEVLVIVAGLAPMLVAGLALLTLLVNLQKDTLVQQREERKFVTELTEKLAHDNPAVRISTASSLAAYLDHEAFRELISTALIGALLLEPDVTVRGALLRSIPAGGAMALQQTRAILPIARIRLDELRAEAVRHEQLVNQLRRDGRVDQISGLEERFAPVVARTSALQHAVIGIAITTRDLIPDSACDRNIGCDQCRIDLHDYYFDRFDFTRTGLQLCNTGFDGSSLVGARFANLDLGGAQFKGSDLREATFRNSSLVGANLSDAVIPWQPYDRGARPSTYFTDADLRGASFARACLSGADFRGARNLEPDQLADAYAAGAKLDPALEQSLKDKNGLIEGVRCQPRLY